MKTAKELAHKAYFDVYLNESHKHPKFINVGKLEERFENWWSEWYSRNDHKDCFDPKHNVYIDGKKYIQAE